MSVCRLNLLWQIKTIKFILLIHSISLCNSHKSQSLNLLSPSPSSLAHAVASYSPLLLTNSSSVVKDTESKTRTSRTTTNTQPDMVAVSIPGDIILGGLFPVHEKGEGVPCGPKIYNRGVHRLEAMLYAVDRVNNDTNLLPGIKIGVHILDTCSRDTFALNQSLQFVRSSLNNLDITAFECSDHSSPKLRKGTNTGPILGVIGGSYSSVSLQVANLLRLFHIPQISPASTAKTLSDKSRFDLFARTVPPDTFQSIALVDIIKSFNWSYVSTIHSEGSYGEYGIEAFHKEANERNVCIAIAEKVPSAADDKDFDAIITKLQKKPNARGVILFTRAEDARRILLAAKRANLSQPFHWVASDGWGKQQKLVEGLEDIAEGAITVELQSEYIPDFDSYMTSLTSANNERILGCACKMGKRWPGLLYTKIFEYIKQDASSMPDFTSWKSTRCVVKVQSIPTFDEALLYEEQFTKTDTEDEENILKSGKVAVDNTNYEHLFANSDEFCVNQLNIIQSRDTCGGHSYLDSPTHPHVTIDEKNPHGDVDRQKSSELGVFSTDVNYDNQIIELHTITDTTQTENARGSELAINDIQENIRIMMNDIARIRTEYISIKILLQKIGQNTNSWDNGSKEKELPEKTHEKVIKITEIYKFPIHSIGALQEWNQELNKNNMYKDYVVKKLTSTFGSDGQSNGDKIAPKLISDVLLTKELLTHTSWTGISRTPNLPGKFSFQSLTSVLEGINCVLINADNRWSMKNIEVVLRDKLLKHFNKRNKAEKTKLKTSNNEKVIKISFQLKKVHLKMLM